jgi:dihydrofolate reductase
VGEPKPVGIKDRQVGILVAVSPEGVIGQDGKIPWRHPGDQRRFKRLTLGTTIIMGRATWLSLPRRPLPERRNVVLTSTPIEGVECFACLASALASCSGNVWVIGGARAYAEAMHIADRIDVTYVPDSIRDPGAVRFPAIDPELFEAEARVAHEDEEGLERQVFVRKSPPSGRAKHTKMS